MLFVFYVEEKMEFILDISKSVRNFANNKQK